MREVWAARSREEYFLGSPAAAEVTGGGGRQGQLGSVGFGRLGALRRLGTLAVVLGREVDAGGAARGGGRRGRGRGRRGTVREVVGCGGGSEHGRGRRARGKWWAVVVRRG